MTSMKGNMCFYEDDLKQYHLFSKSPYRNWSNLSPCYQWCAIYPFPGPLSLIVSQTDPGSLVEGKDKSLLLRKINEYWSKDVYHVSLSLYVFISLPPLSHLFLSAVYDHQVCSSLHTVLSALTPGFTLRRDEVPTGFKLVPAFRTG